MEPIHFHVKRSFWLLRGLGAVAFTAAGFAMMRDGFDKPVAWLGAIAVAFFGIGAAYALREGLRGEPRLTIDADGVHDRSLGCGPIAWGDVAGAAPYTVARNKPFIALQLRDTDKYVARTTGARRVAMRANVNAGMPPFSLNLVGLDADPEHVARLVNARRWKASAAPGADVIGNDDVDDDVDDEEHDGTPPTAERVLHRALVLAAMCMRAQLEGEGATPDNVRHQADQLRWLDDAGAGAECEREERGVLEAAIGTLMPQDVVDASWRAEGMAVLAWALGRAELPPFDRPCAPAEVAEALGFWKAPASPTLRDAEEIEALAGRIFTVHWRLRELSLRRQPLDLAAVAARTRFGLDPDGLPIAEGDLAIDGVPLSRVSEPRWRECLSIATERHRAVNWLLGYEPVYSEVGTDT